MDERVKEFLQKNKPMPATPEEKRKLKGIQLKTIFIILAIMAVSLVIGLVKSDLVVILVIGAIFSVIVLILDIKDKIKYMTYKQIETIRKNSKEPQKPRKKVFQFMITEYMTLKEYHLQFLVQSILCVMEQKHVQASLFQFRLDM